MCVYICVLKLDCQLERGEDGGAAVTAATTPKV